MQTSHPMYMDSLLLAHQYNSMFKSAFAMQADEVVVNEESTRLVAESHCLNGEEPKVEVMKYVVHLPGNPRVLCVGLKIVA